MTQQYEAENPDIPDSFQMLVDLIRETVTETLEANIPEIVSQNIFSLIGAAWQSGYSARDPQIQYYVDRFNEITLYAQSLQDTVDTLQMRIAGLESEIAIMVRDRVNDSSG